MCAQTLWLKTTLLPSHGEIVILPLCPYFSYSVQAQPTPPSQMGPKTCVGELLP